MGCDTRKPVFGVSDHIRHKPESTVTEEGQKLGYKLKKNCYIFVAKTKHLCFSHICKIQVFS